MGGKVGGLTSDGREGVQELRVTVRVAVGGPSGSMQKVGGWVARRVAAGW